MKSEFNWIEGPWPGKVVVLPRPRGGEWLDDEIASWHDGGIGAIASLLTQSEVDELGLSGESASAARSGMEFLWFPIEDRSVPASMSGASGFVKQVEQLLCAGKNVVIHCRGGLGRAPLIAACLLVGVGLHPDIAFQRIAKARGTLVPETAEQSAWVRDFASKLTPASPVPH